MNREEILSRPPLLRERLSAETRTVDLGRHPLQMRQSSCTIPPPLKSRLHHFRQRRLLALSAVAAFLPPPPPHPLRSLEIPTTPSTSPLRSGGCKHDSSIKCEMFFDYHFHLARTSALISNFLLSSHTVYRAIVHLSSFSLLGRIEKASGWCEDSRAFVLLPCPSSTSNAPCRLSL